MEEWIQAVIPVSSLVVEVALQWAFVGGKFTCFGAVVPNVGIDIFFYFERTAVTCSFHGLLSLP